MKGLVIEKPGHLILKDDIPEPALSDYCAITETIACGICNGTDLKLIDGHFKGFDTYPCVLGHESIGQVIETGNKVTSYRKGDHVMRTILDDMGPKYYSGWGSFSERTVVYDYAAMKADGIDNINDYFIVQQVLPQDIDPVKGMMIITFKEVLTGLRSFGAGPGQVVMINGCGPVGLTMVRLARAIGVKKIVAADIDPARLEIAGEMGADLCLNPKEEDVEARIHNEEKEGIDLFIDAVGVNSLINTGLNSVKFNGKIGIYGISPHCSAEIDWTKAPYNWTIQFVQWPNVLTEAALHEEVITFVRKGYLDLDSFVTHVLPMQEFQKGIELIKSREALKVALTIKK